MKNQIKSLRERIKEMEKVIEVLIIAIPKEESSYKFYLDLANSIEHEGSRRMFIKVAKQELAHKGMLEMELKKLQHEISNLRSER
ncbi:MAG: ferritin family protein [Candidatus Scalinduaceae bacterium]